MSVALASTGCVVMVSDSALTGFLGDSSFCSAPGSVVLGRSVGISGVDGSSEASGLYAGAGVSDV